MNIYDFFNSPDVAEHCQSIGHNFNALESAVMISQSDKRTLTEKHAAYRTIIAQYPDLEIPKAANHKHIKSFHQALGEVIVYEEQILEKLFAPEPGTVYQASFRYKRDCIGADEGRLYSTFEKALSDALGNYEDDRVVSVTINQRSPDSENRICLSAKISRSGEIMAVEDYGAGIALLDSCYIDVPVPFKRGDLVEGDHFGGDMGNVYVIQSICRDDPKLHSMSFYGDLSDMFAEVHHEYDGSIGCDTMHFYPDLRYCRRELKGGERLLKYVSLYMQDKLCLCHLLKLQKYFLLDENMSEELLAEIIAKEDINEDTKKDLLT
jgi:hypothetical protein